MSRSKKNKTRSEQRAMQIQKMFGEKNTYKKSVVYKFAQSNGVATARVLETFKMMGLTVQNQNSRMPSIALDWYAKQILSERAIKKWNPNKKYDNWVIGKLAQTNFTENDIKTKKFKQAYRTFLINSFYRFLKLNGYIELYANEQKKIETTYYNPDVIKLRREQ